MDGFCKDTRTEGRMSLSKQPFTPYIENEKERPDTFTVRLNKEERALFEDVKEILEQEKDSTAIKQCFLIAANVLHEKKIKGLLEIIYSNKRKNKRLGVVTFD